MNAGSSFAAWRVGRGAANLATTRQRTVPMRAVVFLLVLLPILVLRPAAAADIAATRRAAVAASVKALPFPRSERSQSVWASSACWNECGSSCAWGFVGCLKRDTQGRCLRETDRCDRACQNQCRTQGGPLLPDLLDF